MRIKSKNIVLIGFMGSGKSSVAKHLGRNLGRFVLDSDEMIEKILGVSIADFFAKEGEKAFRKKEAEFIAWAKKSVQDAIISTGGGMPIFNNVRQMGFVVYLKSDFDSIVERLDSTKIAKRPLFRDLDRARELFEGRREIYAKNADLVVNANATIESITLKIINYLDTKR
ncbi:shikimate kinase [Helicobacter sp. T3_23-1059]